MAFTPCHAISIRKDLAFMAGKSHIQKLVNHNLKRFFAFVLRQTAICRFNMMRKGSMYCHTLIRIQNENTIKYWRNWWKYHFNATTQSNLVSVFPCGIWPGTILIGCHAIHNFHIESKTNTSEYIRNDYFNFTCFGFRAKCSIILSCEA